MSTYDFDADERREQEWEEAAREEREAYDYSNPPVAPGVWCDECGITLSKQATFAEFEGYLYCDSCLAQKKADSAAASASVPYSICEHCGTRHSYWAPCPDRFVGVPTPVEQAAFDGGLVGRVEANSDLPLQEVFSRAEIARLEWLRHAVASGVIQQG